MRRIRTGPPAASQSDITKLQTAILKELTNRMDDDGVLGLAHDELNQCFSKSSTGELRAALYDLHTRELIKVLDETVNMFRIKVTAPGRFYFEMKLAAAKAARKRARSEWIRSIVLLLLSVLLSLVVYATGLADIVKGWFS